MSGILLEVDLSRHGETAWSLSGQATGRTDIPLTHRDERDAQELTKELLDLCASLNSAARERNYTAATGVGELLLEWEPTDYRTRHLDPRLLWPWRNECMVISSISSPTREAKNN